MNAADVSHQMELVDYKKFVEEEYAVALTDLLKSHQIDYRLTTDRESLDSLYGDKINKQEYFVKIRRKDFTRADAVLKELGKVQLADVDPAHYLFSFTDEELRDVLIKQDEWNEFDVQLAQKILNERGQDVSDEHISRLKKERVFELAKPEQTSWFWILLGYFSALGGGWFGILIGWHIRSFKKTLPDGTRIYAFSNRDRGHGSIIQIMGVIMAVTWLAYRFF